MGSRRAISPDGCKCPRCRLNLHHVCELLRHCASESQDEIRTHSRYRMLQLPNSNSQQPSKAQHVGWSISVYDLLWHVSSSSVLRNFCSRLQLFPPHSGWPQVMTCPSFRNAEKALEDDWISWSAKAHGPIKAEVGNNLKDILQLKGSVTWSYGEMDSPVSSVMWELNMTNSSHFT